MDSVNSDSSLWYLTELMPHRPVVRAWLLARFPTLPDVDDLVQESFARVLRSRETTSVRSTRALLFSTARNLALDAIRRQRVVRFEPITDELDSSLVDGSDVVATVCRQQELELLTHAIQSLPRRCRQIFTLRTAYGFTPKQIAEKIGVSLSTVEKEMAKGIRMCAVFFASRETH